MWDYLMIHDECLPYKKTITEDFADGPNSSISMTYLHPYNTLEKGCS